VRTKFLTARTLGPYEILVPSKPLTASKVGHLLKIKLNKSKGTRITLLEHNLPFYERQPSPSSSPSFPLGLEHWSLFSGKVVCCRHLGVGDFWVQSQSDGGLSPAAAAPQLAPAVVPGAV